MGFIRKIVMHRDEKGRNIRIEVKHSENDVLTRKMKTGTEVIVFTAQKDSGIHIVQKSLVTDIILEEEESKYGTFTKIGNVKF